jgi:tripartite-type tricarboxylate transporter receptor subunit TctC
MLSVVGAMTVAPHARKSNTFDTLKDFAPMSLVTSSHLALAVGPGSPAKDLKGLDRYEQLVRYCGWYSSRSRGARAAQALRLTRRQ